MKRIPVAGPWVTEREVEYVADAARNAWYANANVYLRRFEESFAKYVGVRHAVAMPHCTAAIHLSLIALGVGPGDEVIVPDATWIASAAPINYVGATPVFADVDRTTWCLSADAFRAAITPRTKAVIPVDLYGNVPDLPAIQKIARQHNIGVIEDAAEAFGSECQGRRAGAWGDTGVFSFHGSKTLTTGEGGMFVTDRDDLHQRILVLRDHGRAPGDTNFFNHEVAYKYRMSSLQAAFGLAQLERADELIERKREIFRWYHEDLADCPHIELNAEPPGTKNSYWMVTIIASEATGLNQTTMRQRLSDAGIDTRPFFHPLSSLPAYQNCAGVAAARARNQVSYAISQRGINLPSAYSLTREEVRYVSQQVRDLVAIT